MCGANNIIKFHIMLDAKPCYEGTLFFVLLNHSLFFYHKINKFLKYLVQQALQVQSLLFENSSKAPHQVARNHKSMLALGWSKINIELVYRTIVSRKIVETNTSKFLICVALSWGLFCYTLHQYTSSLNYAQVIHHFMLTLTAICCFFLFYTHNTYFNSLEKLNQYLHPLHPPSLLKNLP